MKHILLLLCAALVMPMLAIEPPSPAGIPNRTSIPFESFKQGCATASILLKNPGIKIDADTDDLQKANSALNYIRGFFEAARQIQEYNPDLRVLDPEWEDCGVEEFVPRVYEIIKGLEEVDPKNANQSTTREVLALAIRSRRGVPNLSAPR